MNRRNKIPVTIITGFLGAGKTTFINHLLKSNSSVQFALVENEFGEVDIDTKLIKGVDASQMFELKQGCICCTITDEYELVLQELAERFPNIGHLLIETTGVANPGPVIRPFFTDEKLKELYQFNATVCLVDAINFEKQPEKEITFQQIAVADCILINKTENLREPTKKELRDKIQRLNPLSEVLNAEFGESGAFDLNKMQFRNSISFKQSIPHSSIETKTLTFNSPLNKEDFIDRFSYFLDINKVKIYRVKGIMNFMNEPYIFILQGVGGSIQITEGDSFSTGYKSEVVLIGKLSGIDFDI